MRAQSMAATLLVTAALFCGSESLDARGGRGGGGGHRGGGAGPSVSRGPAYAGGGARSFAGGRGLPSAAALNTARNMAMTRSLAGMRNARQFYAGSGNLYRSQNGMSRVGAQTRIRPEFGNVRQGRGAGRAGAAGSGFVGPIQVDQAGNQINPSRSHPLLNNGRGNFRTGHVNVAPNQNGRKGSWAQDNVANANRLNRQSRQGLRNRNGEARTFAEAKRRHDGTGRHFSKGHGDGKGHGKCGHHDKDWWNKHCHTIVWIDWGYWGLYDGWWYPAWGYDSYYNSYAYDGPIYGYDGLTPDQVVANIQTALRGLGYYQGPIDGVFGAETQEALQRFQNDNGLQPTGAIDPQTVQTLGLTR